VILSDYHLPRFSGLRALELLNGRCHDIPFIALSGVIGDEEAAGLIKLGASDFLLKDRMARLGPAVTQALELKRGRNERRDQEQKITRLSRIHAMLSSINSLIVRVRDRQELFNESCRIAVEHCGFGIAWIGMLDLDTLDVNPVAWAGIDRELLTRNKITARSDVPIGQGVVGRAIRGKRPEIIGDLFSSPYPGGLPTKEAIRRGYRSVSIFPLLTDDSVAGVLTLFAKEADFFTADEVNLLTDLAGNISFALQSIAKQEKFDKLSRIRAVSGEINAAIVRIRERETLLKETCRIVVEHGKFELVWVGVLDPEKQEVRSVAWAGFSPDAAHSVSWMTIKAARGSVGEAIRTRRPAINNNIDASVKRGVLRQEAVGKSCLSTVCIPFVVDDKVVAFCTLFAPGRGFFDSGELTLLDELAADVSFALAYIEKEEKLNFLAYYDALTGLPNRALFDDRMAQHLRAASHEKNKTALVLIDLERFRVINDTLGRSAADDLLKLVAQRLQSVIFDRDSLARVQGDIFAGLFSNIKDEADIARIVEEKIIGCLNQPFTVAGQELRVAAKIGVALFPGDALAPEALFSSAEAALRQAKDSSDRYLFYARKMNAQVAERLKLETKLQKALEQEQFVLFYQPKVDLGTGRVAGLEALIRWNDPETGMVMPMLFIPMLEETGMIVDVGAWAMKQAVTQYAAWQAAGLPPLPIAVNVSQVQLKRKDFVASVQWAIAAAGKAAHGLDLEITESMTMEDIESSIEKLKLIRALGMGIFIDDFGTGHSSLRYLTRLPITALKIDRAFIQHMATNPDDVAIVSTVIALGHNLNLKVIAEGVETEEQSKFLRLLRCDQFQGYLFSKPVPADQVPALLARTTNHG
jgi:diguanylate cyclase (GGDEF)-like protein